MSGSQIHVNAAEVQTFITALERATSTLDGEFGALLAAFSRLGETWKDQQFAQFAGTFKTTAQRIAQFNSEAREALPRLRNYQAKAEEIENIRF